MFPKEFIPVKLSFGEEQALNAKLEVVTQKANESHSAQTKQKEKRLREEIEKPLVPEVYSELDANREITFTEKELNALLARNTGLAKRVAIDLSDNLISAMVLVPVDEDFPVLGGKTIKVKTGVELSYRNSRPVVVLKGVSVMGVPLPNAWIGNIKNIDLVQQFGGKESFWETISDGIEHIQVEKGRLTARLKE
ncbi:MAG: hypothetical protein MRJ65_08115 [Candidatus Brocadiaceae bacterium]|nr:hypothetical protein [Candidatus Brocadiaceae bacterium]